MKRLLLPLLAALTLPTGSLADELGKRDSTFAETVAAEIEAFNLCKIEEGRSRAAVDNEAITLFEEWNLDSNLLNQKNVKQMASRHVKQSGMCNLFKGYDTYSDYIISAQNQGEESFNQLTPTEKKVVKKFSYGNCMYRDGRYSYEEFLSYVRSSFEELVTPDQDLKYLISLTTKPEIIKAGGWFLDNKMDAKTCRNKGIEINTKDAETYYKRGLAKKNSADYQGAIADYSKALELNPKYAKAYFSRGIAQVQLNDYSKSIADLNKAIELNPSEAKMYFSRGLVKELQGEQNKRDACVDLRKASSLGDKDAAKWVSQKCTNY